MKHAAILNVDHGICKCSSSQASSAGSMYLQAWATDTNVQHWSDGNVTPHTVTNFSETVDT